MRLIRIKSEEDYVWLRGVIERAHAKSWNNAQYLHEVQFLIKRVAEQIDNAEEVRDAVDDVVEIVVETPKRRKRTSAKKVKTSKALLYCETHAHYTAQRSPRTDCPQCWDAYTKLNPTKAPAARRKFERAQRAH